MGDNKKYEISSEEKQYWNNEGQKQGSGDHGGIFGRSPWGSPTDAEGEWEQKEECFRKGEENASK